MNAMSPPIKHTKSHKFATLTALAAACTMMLSAPTNAADTDTSATANMNASVPSAIDSSKRTIRRAQPNATVSTAQPDGQPNTAQLNTAQPNTAQPNTAQPNTEKLNTLQPSTARPNTTQPSTKKLTTIQAPSSIAQAAAETPMAVTPQPTGASRVYQPQPISSTGLNSSRSINSTANNSSGIDISRGQLPNIPVAQARLSDISFVPTVLIAQQQGADADKLDVSLLDDFITEVSPNARHYPPNFPNRSQRHYTRENIKVLTEWIEPYARAPNASYDVLIRAAKLNGIGRNLDLGSDFAVRGGQYVDRAIKNNPNSGEANFLYGMMLAEGGGFKEGQKYLDRAVALGYTEAEQSLAQSDLLSDRRNQALDRLRRLEQQVPDNSVIRQQIKLIEDGKYYIWDLSAPDINIKPMT